MRVAGGGGWSKRLTERAFVVSGWSGRERGTVGSAGQIAESGMESEYSGTGIGLSICKKIVQNHHGLIEARASEDKGAEFIVILPAKQNFTDETV